MQAPVSSIKQQLVVIALSNSLFHVEAIHLHSSFANNRIQIVHALFRDIFKASTVVVLPDFISSDIDATEKLFQHIHIGNNWHMHKVNTVPAP